MSRLPPFPTDRAGYIAALNEYISRGVNVENSKRALRNILENTKPDIPDAVDPKHLGLPELVIARIKSLEGLEERFDLDPQDRVNVKAIVKAYESGDLDVIEGEMSFWWDGINKTGPVTDIPGDLAQLLSAWRGGAPGGRLWVEKGRASYQMLAQAAFP